MSATKNERRRGGKSLYLASVIEERGGSVVVPFEIGQTVATTSAHDDVVIWIEQADQISREDFERMMRLTNWPLAPIIPFPQKSK